MLTGGMFGTGGGLLGGAGGEGGDGGVDGGEGGEGGGGGGRLGGGRGSKPGGYGGANDGASRCSSVHVAGGATVCTPDVTPVAGICEPLDADTYPSKKTFASANLDRVDIEGRLSIVDRSSASGVMPASPVNGAPVML